LQLSAESNPIEGSKESSKKTFTKKQDFGSKALNEILVKAEGLAVIYGGRCLSSNGLSNCKGKNSIRFNCINGHNFYLSEDKIKQANLQTLTSNWKRARRDLKAFQASKLKGESTGLPKTSISFMDDHWCSKCLEYFIQTTKIAI